MRQGTNRLGSETSPYLLQHATNPVHWFPWGTDAFREAAAEDKPVFLSVGYAACHWCHVMERESFEDPATADFLNEHFVSVKVDREERPDVDAVYMRAVQAMNQGHGGWPMSVFTAPDGRPFFAGTYFPPTARPGYPAFLDVLRELDRLWHDDRDRVLSQGERLVEVLSARSLADAGSSLDPTLPDVAVAALAEGFDEEWGGFGSAPKFPQAPVLWFLAERAGDDGRARTMLERTLERMDQGGIHDQLGGGFARYATDRRWLIPHFEKMLSDNALLARIYTRAWLVTHVERDRRVATGILDDLLGSMHDPDGGFWSSIDADSEGIEGKYYCWGWEELVDLVGEPAARGFGATRDGNWSERGTNVLTRPPLDPGTGQLTEAARGAVAVLSRERTRREPPSIDDKVVTAWNGLTIRALVDAGRAFDEPRYVGAAIDAASFLWTHLVRDDGRLLRAWRRGQASDALGFADDHAFAILAFLTVYEVTADAAWLERASQLADALRDLFLDEEEGGFFLAGRDADQTIVRHKELEDQAVPSANAAAAEALLRLAAFNGDQRLEDVASAAVAAVGGLARRVPAAFTHVIAVQLGLRRPVPEIVIVGDPGDAATRRLERAAIELGAPRDAVVLSGSPATIEEQGLTIPLLSGKRAVGGRPTAYVCRRFECRRPVHTPDDLLVELRMIG